VGGCACWAVGGRGGGRVVWGEEKVLGFGGVSVAYLSVFVLMVVFDTQCIGVLP
jgi:hypothetical protein